MKMPSKLVLSYSAPVAVAAAAVAVLMSHAAASNSMKVLDLNIKPVADGGNGNGNGGVGNGNGNGNLPGSPGKNFSIDGTVGSLVPGVTRSLRLRLNNPNNQAIKVQSLTVTATGGT